MTQSFHQKTGCAFDIKGSLFPDTKENTNASQMLSFEHVRNVFLRRVGNRGGRPRKGILGATCIPLFFSVKYERVTRDVSFVDLVIESEKRVLYSTTAETERNSVNTRTFLK